MLRLLWAQAVLAEAGGPSPLSCKTASYLAQGFWVGQKVGNNLVAATKLLKILYNLQAKFSQT